MKTKVSVEETTSSFWKGANNAHQNSQQEMERKAYWESVFGPFGRPYGKIRGSWLLFVPEGLTLPVWSLIAKLTEEGELGYLASISPGPMISGQHAGYFCIAIHAEPRWNAKVVLTLLANNVLVPYLQRYRLRDCRHPYIR